MRFKSPTEQPIHLAATTGHTCVIGPDYVDVDARFHRDAVAHGAIPEGFENSKAPVQPAAEGKSDLIIAAIRAMVTEANEEDFTAQGKPDVSRLSERVGFTVTASERNAAWDEVGKD